MELPDEVVHQLNALGFALTDADHGNCQAPTRPLEVCPSAPLTRRRRHDSGTSSPGITRALFLRAFRPERASPPRRPPPSIL